MSLDLEALITQMTLEEKINLLAGADLWYSVPVPRLGIPTFKVTDGPNGARGANGSTGATSVCFPCGSALAATWDTALVEEVGQALAEEVRAKGAHMLLAPTVNLHRHPLAGRNFECYSEDPYLTGKMASAYIRGLQHKGVGACIKHFIANDQEFERNSISSEVSERPLRELYLKPFEMALREAKPWAVMSSYNRLNGTYCSEHNDLLRKILKEEWGFDGMVMSDWFGTYSPAVPQGGLDYEMPGPARWMADSHVKAALADGSLTLERLDDKVRRILRTLERTGCFDQPEPSPERAEDRPEHRRLVRKAAAEAVVLLKNDADLLPLKALELRSLAVIGANARWAQILGGGSAHVNSHYVVSPLEGIRSKVGSDCKVEWAWGALMHRSIPILDPDWLHVNGQARQLKVELFDNLDLSGDPAHTFQTDRTNIEWSDALLGPVTPTDFSARMSAELIVPLSGTYTFSLQGNGRSRLLLDGRMVVDHWAEMNEGAPWGAEEVTDMVELAAGQRYHLVVEFACHTTSPWRALRLGGLMPAPADTVGEAAALAARCDAAIVVVGQTNEWESENFDRTDLELPGEQNQLVEAVLAANPRTVVVLVTGAPVTLPWLGKAPAVLQTWFAGQEAGNALADVLFGDRNPCGRLPQTWPLRLQDTPAYINFPGENGRVYYGEGLFIGYRYYDRREIPVLFPFGYGMSYTSFELHDLTTPTQEGDATSFSLQVTNTGQQAGAEIVQVYLHDVQSTLVRPEKELKAFARVELEPGETRTVRFTLDSTALVYWDPGKQGWVAEAGEYEVRVGRSAAEIWLTARFTI